MGLTAGASAPDILVQQVIDRLRELVADEDLGERDAADLATGIALPIAPGELRVLRLAPLR